MNPIAPWRRLLAFCLAYGLFFSAVLAGAHALPSFADHDAALHSGLCGVDQLPVGVPDQPPNEPHHGGDLPCCVAALSAVLPLPSLHALPHARALSRVTSWLPAFHDPVAGYPLSAPGMLRAPPVDV